MRRGVALLPLALVILGVLEIATVVLLGRWIGWLPTLLLLMGASVLGVVLLRREGGRAWRRFRASAGAGTPPGPQVTDGLVGLGGALLLAVPGPVTSVAGLVLLAPPVRRLAGAGVRRAAERRLPSSAAGDLFGPRRVRVRRSPAPGTTKRPAGPGDEPPPGPAIEGEIVEP